MITIIEGMTTEEFITAINNNLNETIGAYIEIDDTITTEEIETILNANFLKSDKLVGISGSNFINIINTNFNEHDISINKPIELAIEWIEDFANITFTDNSGGTAQHEIWESKNGGVYELVKTLDAGIEIYEYPTWQNASLNFKIRAKNENLYSIFTNAENIITPLIIKSNQSTLTQLDIKTFRVSPGGTINMNFGDGTDHNFTGMDQDFIKDYEIENDCYFITISGDIDKLTGLDWVSQTHLFGDLTKWIYPINLVFFHFYSNTNVTGDITNWVLSSEQGIFHIAGDDFYGNITNWVIPKSIYDLRLDYNRLTGDLTNWILPMDNGQLSLYFTCKNNEHLYGNISNWIFPDNMVLLILEKNYFTGDLTEWIIPSTMVRIGLMSETEEHNSFTGDISCWNFATVEHISINFIIKLCNAPFTGDLSETGMLDGTKEEIINCAGCNLTLLPRGYFKWVSEYNFSANNCITQEIDDILAYIDAYFVGEIIPLTNCIYTLNGTGMGIPSAAGLTSKTSIEGKYTAEGKTATISVNS